MKRFATFLLVAAMPLLSAASCGEKADPTLQSNDAFQAEDQTDAMTEVSGEAVFLSSLTEAPADASTSENAASSAAEGASETYGDCITHTAEANVVTYELQSCTGPWGFLTLTGTVVSTYTLVAPGTLRAVVEATGLEVNQGLADLNATVDRTFVDGVKRSSVTTSWVGRTSDNKLTTRNGTYVTEIDEEAGCMALDGMWATSVGLSTWDTTVDSFSICRGECPAAGGVVTYTGQNARDFELRYDGSSTATWTNSQDESGEVQLACGSV